MPRFPRLGLSGGISAALLVVGLLPLGAASFRLMGMNRDAMTEQVLRTHAVAAQTAAARVEALLAARRSAAQAVATSAALAADPHSAAATERLSELLRADFGVAAVSVRTEGGAEVVRVQRPALAEAIAAVLALPLGDELAVTQRDGSAWLRIDVPLAGERGRLQVVCDLAPLLSELRPQELGDEAEVVMVDRAGALLPGSVAPVESFPHAMMTAAMTGRVSGAGRFAAASGEAGEAVLGAYAPVGGTPWIVLSRQPARVAESTARTMRRRALVAVAVAVVLALGMAGVARRTIVRPIQALLRAADISPERAGAGGEIARLKATFAELERRLREREALGEVVLGRYRVEAVVGEGAMGTVFRAWDPALRRPVAIKTVRFDRWLAAERVELAARLLDEAVTVAAFSHPNIVGLYDVEESPEVVFLAMEYVDGVSLEHHLQAHGALPATEAIAIARGIAGGLAAAHARGVVHHDVKPANVLLGRDGSVKVVDFGISQVITSLAADPDAVFGTPGFIPPETLQGERYGPGGDLFALGVTCYRMLTGRMPFSGNSAAELVASTLTAAIVPPGEIVETVPAELDALVMSLLERDPRRRCRSAGEVLRRLDFPAAQPGGGAEPAPVFLATRREPARERAYGSQLVSRLTTRLESGTAG